MSLDHRAAFWGCKWLRIIQCVCVCVQLPWFQHFLLSVQVHGFSDSTAQSNVRHRETETKLIKAAWDLVKHVGALLSQISIPQAAACHADMLRSVLMGAVRKCTLTNNSLSSRVLRLVS